MTIDLTKALAVAEDCARRAGALLRDAMQRPITINYKGTIDLVTESDRQSEQLIAAGILAAFPDHHIISEESGVMGAPREQASYRWYIDPLDGTSNFAHHFPHFSVSVAMAGTDDQPLVGVVYDPVRDECFAAQHGGGATLNGRPMHVSARESLAKAVLASGFPPDRWTNRNNNTDEWVSFVTRVQGLRRTGSAALDLSYVAAGRLDGYWELRLKSWDVMAGLLLVTEAGGQVSNYHNQLDGVYMAHEVVASNKLLHEQILTVLILGNDAPKPN